VLLWTIDEKKALAQGFGRWVLALDGGGLVGLLVLAFAGGLVLVLERGAGVCRRFGLGAWAKCK